MRLRTALPILLAASLAAPLAWADSGPVATADKTASAPNAVPADEKPIAIGDHAAPPVADEDGQRDRRIHGEIAVAVGSGGYRGIAVEAHGPLGDRGEAGVAISASQGGRGHPLYGRPPIAGPMARTVCVGQGDAPPLPDGAAPLDPDGRC